MRLQLSRSTLGIEQAQLDQKDLLHTERANKAKLRAAEEEIDRRNIEAPFDGVIVEILARKGEWVNPGEPVMRVVRMDRLRVERFLNANEHDPGRISGRPVTVEVELAGRRKVQLSGQIVFGSPLIRAGNIYRVRAEVENRKRDGQWLLRPGMAATMTIDLR